jgi:hypothetical protein
VLPIVAIDVLEDDQVPPAGVQAKVDVLLTQAIVEPLIDVGEGITVTVLITGEPHPFV